MKKRILIIFIDTMILSMVVGFFITMIMSAQYLIGSIMTGVLFVALLNYYSARDTFLQGK
jgi:hypothetical protein